MRSGVHGVPELVRVLRALPREMARDQVMLPALRAGARVIVKGAKARLEPHSRTGDLAASLTTRKGRGNTWKRAVVHVGFKPSPAGWRAHFQEFGTRKMAAKPFLRPALDEDGGGALGAFSRTFGKKLAQTTAKLAGRYGSLRKRRGRRRR